MMLRSTASLGFVAGVSVALAGCIFGEGSSDQISISPERVSIEAGSAPVVFTASTPPNAGHIVWLLDGPGALTSQTDTSAVFTPPATVLVPTSATVSALLGSGARASAHIEIRLPDLFTPDGGTPDGGPPVGDALRIIPASATVFAGSPPIDFRAVPPNGSAAVSWSLIGPGTLSFPGPLIARYTPPSDAAVDIGALLTAQLTAPSQTGRADILVRRPVGTLTLAVSVPPGSGLVPTIYVTGPGGFARTVRASQTLPGLPVGIYRADARTELVVESIVTNAYVPNVVGNPAVVAAGDTARIQVTYAARRGSGHLWLNDGIASRLGGYSGAQLASSGTVTASIQIQQTGGFGAALGSDGDLWVAADPFTLTKYAAAHLERGAVPDVRLGRATRGGVLDYLSGLAFDSGGNLWLASNPPPGPDTNRRILKFSASGLRVSNPDPTPEVTLYSTTRWYPVTLAFDRAGNLWLADFINDRLVKFTPAQLASSGAPAPTTVISNVSPGYPLRSPIDLAIDADGDLWVANLSAEQPTDLIMYTATQAQAGGSPNPAIRLGRPTLLSVRGIAFDATGGAWMAVPGGLARLSHAQLFGGGAPLPQIFVRDSSILFATALLFDPPPAGVPLYR